MKPMLLVLLAAAFAPVARANITVLLARSDRDWRPVTAVTREVPLVVENGKLIQASSNAYRLAEVKRYWRGMPPPVLVQVDGLSIDHSTVRLSGVDGLESNMRVVSGTLCSPVSLDRVFAAFELRGPSRKPILLVREIGTLKAGEPRTFEFTFAPPRGAGMESCTVHVYSDGFELLQAGQGPEALREEIGRRIRANLEGVAQGDPQLFYAPAPVRPAVSGPEAPVSEVKVVVEIAPDGSVSSAGAAVGVPPEYASAAEAAARSYHFIPKVVDGKPCACRVVVPVRF